MGVGSAMTMGSATPEPRITVVCPRTPVAAHWLDFVQPVFVDSSYAAFRQDVGLSDVLATDTIGIAVDTIACAGIQAAVDSSKAHVDFKYQLDVLRLGQYYAVVVHPLPSASIVVDGRREVIVFDRSTLEIVLGGLMF